MIKWVAAVLGYFLFRFPGAILGFFLGSLLDSLGGSSNGSGTVFKDFTKQTVSPADFELNLLSLCSIIIKADGQVSQRELDYVRQYFLSTYGKEKDNAIGLSTRSSKKGRYRHSGSVPIWCSAPVTRSGYSYCIFCSG